ncbi:hypothetical protein V6N13_068658 [Hibiscus sabdariffa]
MQRGSSNSMENDPSNLEVAIYFFFWITVQTPPESGRSSGPVQQKKSRAVPDSSKESSAVPGHAKPLQSKAPESRYAHDSNPEPQDAVSLLKAPS